jgi:repressor LexA
MTKLQKKVLDFIKAFWAEHGYAPSYSEIGAHMGLSSKGSVHRFVCALSDRGFIKYRYGRARSIIVLERAIAPPAKPVV